MKVVSIVGARPQFIKMAAVARALRGVRHVIVHTGQHYDENLSGVFFRELGLPRPDYNLGVGSGPHGQQTGRMLEAAEQALMRERPDWVLVYGDTNSTLAGALAAAKLHLRTAHVEAGLRSFNRRMPEEINRVLADHLSDILFAPTPEARRQLLKEGVPRSKIHVVGDVMYDAALRFAAQSERRSQILSRLRLRPREYVLATIHRAENADDFGRLDTIMRGLKAVARHIPVVLPLHPRTRKARPATDGLCVIDPVGYLDMVQLERNARVIATDSGGVQKEAFFYRVPCVTLRTETEWSELVRAGWNRVVPPTSAQRITDAILTARRGRPVRLYGDGRAAERIVGVLKNGFRPSPPVQRP